MADADRGQAHTDLAGAPVNPNLRRKAITTSWISAILFAILWACIQYHLVHLPTIPTTFR